MVESPNLRLLGERSIAGSIDPKGDSAEKQQNAAAKFGREAIRRFVLSDMTASELARELAMPRTKLYAGVRNLKKSADEAFPCKSCRCLSV